MNKKIKIDKITFYYKIPENAQIGTKIEVVAQIMVEEEKEIEQYLQALLVLVVEYLHN